MAVDCRYLLRDSFEYTREALRAGWKRWLILFGMYLIFPLFKGYTLHIYRGDRPAPEPGDWGRMFIDGILVCSILILYLIPVAIAGGIGIVAIGPIIPASITDLGPQELSAFIALFGTVLLVVMVLALVLSLLSTIGIVRFARTDRFSEAFRIPVILAHIRGIGWSDYLIALTVLWLVSLVYYAISWILGMVPVMGGILALFTAPAWGIYSVRFITGIYESGDSP